MGLDKRRFSANARLHPRSFCFRSCVCGEDYEKALLLNGPNMSRTWMRCRDLLPLQPLLRHPSWPPSSSRPIDQRAVSKTELASYQSLVQARIERNPDSPAWDRLDDAWLHVVAHAKGILAAEKQGRAGVRHERIAAREVATLADAVPARAVVVCTLAMFVMWEMEPRRFRSDDAFRTQLARRVRRLTEANAAHYFDDVADKGKRVYRDVAPRSERCSGGGCRRRWAGPAFSRAAVCFTSRRVPSKCLKSYNS